MGSPGRASPFSLVFTFSILSWATVGVSPVRPRKEDEQSGFGRAVTICTLLLWLFSIGALGPFDTVFVPQTYSGLAVSVFTALRLSRSVDRCRPRDTHAAPGAPFDGAQDAPGLRITQGYVYRRPALAIRTERCRPRGDASYNVLQSQSLPSSSLCFRSM